MQSSDIARKPSSWFRNQGEHVYIMTPSTKPFECCYHIITHRINIWYVLPTFAKKTILHVGKYTKNSIEPTIYSMMSHVCHSEACMFGVCVLQFTRCFCLTFPFHTSCKRVVSMGGSEASWKRIFRNLRDLVEGAMSNWCAKCWKSMGTLMYETPKSMWRRLYQGHVRWFWESYVPTPTTYYLPKLLLLLLEEPLALLHDRTAG